MWDAVHCDLVWGRLVEARIENPDASQKAQKVFSLKEHLSGH